MVGMSILGKGYAMTGSYNGVWPNFVSNETWEFDPASNSWIRRADLPVDGRYQSFGAVVGSKGYLGSGQSAFGTQSDLWEYNAPANTWVSRTGQFIASKSTAVSVGSKILAHRYFNT